MNFTPDNEKHGREITNITGTPPMPQLSQSSGATTLSQRAPELPRGVVQTSNRKGDFPNSMMHQPVSQPDFVHARYQKKRGDMTAQNVGKILEKYMAVPEYNRKPLLVIMPKTELEIMLQNASANGFHGHFPGEDSSNWQNPSRSDYLKLKVDVQKMKTENGTLHMEIRSEETGRANEMKMRIERLDRECCKNKKISDEQDKTINGYTTKIEEKKKELAELTEYFKKLQHGKEQSDVKKEVLPVANGVNE